MLIWWPTSMYHLVLLCKSQLCTSKLGMFIVYSQNTYSYCLVLELLSLFQSSSLGKPLSGYPDLFRGCFSQLHHQEMSLVRSIILCMDGPVKLWVDVMPDPFGASFCEGALTLWHLLLANFLPMLQHLPNPCNIFLWNHVPNADCGLVMLNPLPSPYSGTFLCSQRVLGLLHKIHLW